MRRALALLVFALLVVGALAVPAAQSASPNVVVSQVYGGGGNAGAPYLNDFVELFNRGSSAVDVGGWTVQYASASGGTVGASLPSADATGTSNLAVSGGKIAVVRDATPLTCGASAGSCSAVGSIADLVGYGGAADYEGSAPAPDLDNTTAATRASDGCTDTDDNATDFSAAAAAPRNSSAPATTCGAEPPPAGGGAESATVDIDIESARSIALERSSVSCGSAATGTTPARVSEQVTVVSNDASGYSLTVHRAAFQPADLPLGIAGSAPAGGQIGGSLAGGAIAAIPIAPTPDLLVGTTSAPSTGTGDVWGTSLGFTGSLPVVPAGRYTTTVMFTVIGR